MNDSLTPLWTYLKPYRRYLVIGPATKVVEVVFDIATPLIIAHMIDRAVAGAQSNEIINYGILLVVMTVVGFSFTLICQKVAAITSQGFGTRLRQALYHKINTLSAAEVNRFGTASLITRLTSDINQLQIALALMVRMVVRWPFIALLSMTAALLINWQLGLIFLVCTPLVACVFWFVMKRSVPFFRVMQERLDRVTQVAREGLEGTRVVRAFVREDHERERFAQASYAQTDVAVATGRLSALLNPATILIMDLGIVCILLLAGERVNEGSLTQGQLVAFSSYMTQVLVSISYVANMVVTFTRASASAKRITDVLSCEPSILNSQAPVEPLPTAQAALSFERVCFTYPGAAGPALTNISFSLPQGATLGIIGGTGSGKSTFAALIARLYDASEGRVRVLGSDVKDWNVSDLMRSVGFVPQHVALISGTVRSNLLWGTHDQSTSDEDLWRALEVAQAKEFVSELPDGLDAQVEADGRNFSGGQRQRLSIARAIVAKPRILVLDDASSALDYATDAKLRRAVRSLDGLDACVIVSQRVASVRGADLVAVLDRGELVGLGTHDELLERCKVYQEICRTQHVGGGA